jgi:hypothetical protein
MHGTYIKKDGSIFVLTLLHREKKVTLGTTKLNSMVIGMRLRKQLLKVSNILYNPSNAIMRPLQNLGEKPTKA